MRTPLPATPTAPSTLVSIGSRLGYPVWFPITDARDLFAEPHLTPVIDLRANVPPTVALREQLGWTTAGQDGGYVLLKAP